ncbi:hypothetical protein CC80DRAFT_516353 [Byssothecium circinans]|uniref:Uncharacterized protein n=1 Tax=Byssothecium circinans TaxID=147558 RepID=A0A6A5TTY0_9PLEO|nr:hypothetical protein CC80DRAFT_516353 [Byssothecium circinans]
MPRQLPWKNKGGGSGSKTRTLPQKTAPKPRIQSDIDDDFFADTVLARDPRDSDDDFPELPHATPNARTSRKSKGKDPVEGSRLLSSSPPPAEELPPPEIEYMDKGVDKFDLRDDEWMMVEDELLQTAKLFTRHLHLAEYDRMKADIDEKKLRNEKTPRPVVPGAKPSIVGQFKKKAEKQSKVQKAFFDAEDESEEEESPRDTLSKETSDRLAKRKADKDKESRSKARKKDVDDIPTFMF